MVIQRLEWGCKYDATVQSDIVVTLINSEANSAIIALRTNIA